MKIFVAGATGVIGRSLLPLLLDHGHEVTALTRSQQGADRIRQLGAKPVVCDVFDRRTLGESVVKAEPEVMIHQLTAIPKRLNPRRIGKELAPTNRLRIEGTMRSGDTVVAQSKGLFVVAEEHTRVLDESG